MNMTSYLYDDVILYSVVKKYIHDDDNILVIKDTSTAEVVIYRNVINMTS